MWSDYLCPWCYLGRDRTALIENLGVTVTPLPYDLHPELPPVGRRVVADGRLAEVHARASRRGVRGGRAPVQSPRAHPKHTPRARAGEVVRGRRPEAFAALDAALFGRGLRDR